MASLLLEDVGSGALQPGQMLPGHALRQVGGRLKRAGVSRLPCSREVVHAGSWSLAINRKARSSHVSFIAFPQVLLWDFSRLGERMEGMWAGLPSQLVGLDDHQLRIR